MLSRHANSRRGFRRLIRAYTYFEPTPDNRDECLFSIFSIGKHNMTGQSHCPMKVSWFIWSLGVLFYMMGFFHRVAPAVMTTELMHDFNISAAGLGNLSGFYFYSYVAMQIPTGILADTWGPRRLLGLGSLVAGIGTLIFALSPHIIWANIGRFLIGGSVAVAFVGSLKILSTWFLPHYFAMVSGIALFFGLVGAVISGPPLSLLMDFFNWRSIFIVVAVFNLMLCACIWIFIRDFPHEKGYADLNPYDVETVKKSQRNILQMIFKVFKYKNIFPLCIINNGIVGCVLTFTGLWGVPYLTTHYNMPTSQAAAMSSAALVAWGLGGPFFGWLSEHLGYRKLPYLVGYAISMFGWAIIFFIPNIPIFLLFGILLVSGFCGGCMILSFAFAKDSVPDSLSATVSGIINMGSMIGPTIMQPTVGWILDKKWQGAVLNGVRVYGLDAYQAGFSLMIAGSLASFIFIFFTRETYREQTV